MPFLRLAVGASGALWTLFLFGSFASCLAQGPAIPSEIRGVEAAAELIGASALVRGALERLLGPSAARGVLGVTSRELGWRVIETDVYASAVATSPALRQAGNTEAFLASINDLRAFRAQATSAQNSLNLLSVNNLSQNSDKMIRAVTVEPKIAPQNDLSKWVFTIKRDGIKIDPGYTIPIWDSRSSTVNMKLDEINGAISALPAQLFHHVPMEFQIVLVSES
jgi:hypothetical protein